MVLKEECAGEGEAMIESLKRGAPYYRVEIWQARAVVKDGVSRSQERSAFRAHLTVPSGRVQKNRSNKAPLSDSVL